MADEIIKDILHADLLWLGYPEAENVSSSDHTHEELDQLADIITLLNSGVTGTRTIGGYTITVNHGIITGFEEA